VFQVPPDGSGSVAPREQTTPAGRPVIPALAYALMALAGVAALWGLLTAVLDQPPGKAQLLFAAGVWVVTAVQSVIGLVRLAGGFRPTEPATTVGYLLAILVLIPLAWFWANSERTRWSGVVLAVAALSVLSMTLRLIQLWTPAPA
jgi:hypothetical protein